VIDIKLLVIICIIFNIFLIGCSEEMNEDFELSIEIVKTGKKVGDEVKCIVYLKNLTGKDVNVKMMHTDFKTLEDMILVGHFKKGMEHNFALNLKEGHKEEVLFKKGEVVKKEYTFIIEENVDYEISAISGFFVGVNFEEYISIKSEVMKIKIV